MWSVQPFRSRPTLSQYLYIFWIFQLEIGHFLQLLVHTYCKHTNNFCYFACLKLHLAGDVIIGYLQCIQFFYRAMLCIRGTSHGPVSVRLSVSLCLSVSATSRSSTKTAKRWITQTTPHDSPGTLVFWCQRSPRNSTGVTPYEGAECRWSGQNRRLSTNNRLYLENGTR